VNVSGYRYACAKLSQHGDAASGFVCVQNHQFNAIIRTGLPLFLFGEGDVLEHATTLNRAAKKINCFSLGRRRFQITFFRNASVS
jgi:hypothetical protein